MNNLRLRIMVKKESNIPFGVWAYYANGTVKSYDDADTGAIGVALVTANVSILIDKQESGALAFGGMNKNLTGAATFTSSPFTDFNGENNTTGIIAACAGYTASGITGAPAAEYCRARLNGKGYLPSKGEIHEIGLNVTAIRNMMIKIGGGQYPNANRQYWTSTLGGNVSTQAWRQSGYYYLQTDYTMDRTNTYYVRAICKLPIAEDDIPFEDVVDLGLPSGLLWAKGNIVSNGNGGYKVGLETDYGAYVSWGNVTPHFSSNGLSFDDGYNWGSSNTGSPYKDTPGAGISFSTDNKEATYLAEVTYDAACNLLGGSWRMPTAKEFKELYDNTDSEWTTINGVAGRKFMKKTDHSIYVFFPAAGIGDGAVLDLRGSRGIYWSSSLSAAANGYYLRFDSSIVNPQQSYTRYRGCSIRAVYSP